MTSKAQGKLVVPVWSDDGVIKALVDDNGRIPVNLEIAGVTLDVNLESSDITLDVNHKSSDITLNVNLETSDITLGVTESSPLTSIQAQGYGYDGSNWQKNPLVWGYTDNYIEAQSDLNAAAVVGTLTFATVPSGEVWRITQWIGVDVQTKCTNYILELVRSAVPYSLSTVVPAAANDYKGTLCDIILKEDDSLRMAFVGTVAGDDIYGWLHGYKMDVS